MLCELRPGFPLQAPLRLARLFVSPAHPLRLSLSLSVTLLAQGAARETKCLLTGDKLGPASCRAWAVIWVAEGRTHGLSHARWPNRRRGVATGCLLARVSEAIRRRHCAPERCRQASSASESARVGGIHVPGLALGAGVLSPLLGMLVTAALPGGPCTECLRPIFTTKNWRPGRPRDLLEVTRLRRSRASSQTPTSHPSAVLSPRKPCLPQVLGSAPARESFCSSSPTT